MSMPSVHSSFLKKYKKDAINALKNMNPEWDKDDIDKVVTEEMKSSFTNPEVTIDNNYTQQRDTTTLLTVFDWAEEKKPIIAGNGTFYKNQYEAVNPIAGMLMGILEKRKAAKKAMFALADPNSAKYKDLDLLQSIFKINANS